MVAATIRRLGVSAPMLTCVYIDALSMDAESPDQVWLLSYSRVITDDQVVWY
jgi:hypothetical protein